MSWLLVWQGMKTGAGWLRGLPWWVWLALAVLLLGWRWGEHRFDAGVAEERGRWKRAEEQAAAAAQRAAQRRDKAASAINTTTATAGAETSARTRETTAAAAERVDHEIQTIVVPADCPVALPARVQAELARASERAAAAGSALRAGPGP